MYQIYQEKLFCVVIRNLHHTTDKSFIKEELKSHGYNAVQVVNALQWQTKTPLSLFFVDLEPDQHNNIFKLSSICFAKIKVEELPHVVIKSKRKTFSTTKARTTKDLKQYTSINLILENNVNEPIGNISEHKSPNNKNHTRKTYSKAT
jgi:hypothetical protein